MVGLQNYILLHTFANNYILVNNININPKKHPYQGILNHILILYVILPSMDINETTKIIHVSCGKLLSHNFRLKPLKLPSG
jgi:hypothetical protein